MGALQTAIVTELGETGSAGSGEVGPMRRILGAAGRAVKAALQGARRPSSGCRAEGTCVARDSARCQGRHTDKGGTRDGQGWEQGLCDQRGGCSSLIFHGCKHKAVNRSKMLSGKKFQPVYRDPGHFPKKGWQGVAEPAAKNLFRMSWMEWRCNSRDQALF